MFNDSPGEKVLKQTLTGMCACVLRGWGRWKGGGRERGGGGGRDKESSRPIIYSPSSLKNVLREHTDIRTCTDT